MLPDFTRVYDANSIPVSGTSSGSSEGYQNLWNPRKTRLLAGFFVIAFRRIPTAASRFKGVMVGIKSIRERGLPFWLVLLLS